MNLLDKIHSLFCFSVAALPLVYLLDKHGLTGFIKLFSETFNALS